MLEPAPVTRRRLLLLAALAPFAAASAQDNRTWRIGFANLTDDPSARIEGLGFTGAEVRRSIELAARSLPVAMTYFDNEASADKAVANAEAAVEQKLDLLIEYNLDAAANAAIAARSKAARLPLLAVNHPIPGAPLYSIDSRAAGRIAGQALTRFVQETWPEEKVVAVIAGDLGDPSTAVADRAAGIVEGLRQGLPDLVPDRLDTSGNPLRLEGLLTRYLKSQSRRKVLVATLDDPTALAAKSAIEIAGRLGDCVIVGQGVDRSIHGGASQRKELDPANRGSIVIGSVAYYLDRLGDEVLPLALRMLRGEAVPARTTVQHKLITAKDIFREYPPMDMN